MFSLFKTFILRRVSPELTDIYIFSLETLRDFYGDSVVEFSEQLIEQLKEESTENVISEVTKEFRSYLINAIKQFGIKLDNESLDDNSIYLLTNILHGLLSLEYYEDIEQILGTLESSDNNTEILSQLLTIVTGEYLEFNSVIIEVNEDFIIKLKELTINRQELLKSEEATPLNPLLVKFFEKEEFKSHCNKAIGTSLTTNPHRLTLTRILKLYGNRIADENQWGTWLLVILVAKDYNNPGLLFSHWENYFLEPDSLVDMKHKVLNAFNTLMEE